MRARARATGLYILVVMLAAAAAGRLLDALGLLPGVHEAADVRGAATGWLTAVLAACLVGTAAARQWSRTTSLPGTAAVVVPGQVLVFVGAETSSRLASGLGPVDPDGLAGAALQAALALGLLLAVTSCAAVALRVLPPVVLAPPPAAARSLPRPARLAVRRFATLVDPRGPPLALDC
ncbi:MAG: hypothetical protein NVS3B26_16860 [Mycobacteriales bacterium]